MFAFVNNTTSSFQNSILESSSLAEADLNAHMENQQDNTFNTIMNIIVCVYIVSMMETIAMEQTIHDVTACTKWRPYNRYSDNQRASIGQYASVHGNSAAAITFSAELGKPVNESTVRSMKRKYEESLSKENVDELDRLPKCKRGRPFILGDDFNKKVQDYITAQKACGTAITREITIAFGIGIVKSHDENLLVENGGKIELTKHWASFHTSLYKICKTTRVNKNMQLAKKFKKRLPP